MSRTTDSFLLERIPMLSDGKINRTETSQNTRTIIITMIINIFFLSNDRFAQGTELCIDISGLLLDDVHNGVVCNSLIFAH